MRGLRQVFCLALSVLAIQAIYGQQGTVTVESGKLQRVTPDPVEAFNGIPFAAPPTGELR